VTRLGFSPKYYSYHPTPRGGRGTREKREKRRGGMIPRREKEVKVTLRQKEEATRLRRGKK